MKFNLFSVVNKTNIENGFRMLSDIGMGAIIYRFKELLIDNVKYTKWLKMHTPTQEILENQRQERFSYEPLISIIVPTYNTPITYLEEMISSVYEQTYSVWELCIADASVDNVELRERLAHYETCDNRIKVSFLENNYGIAGNTNKALAMAQGEYIGLLDHDDVLGPDALYEVAKLLNSDKTIDVIYTDEDKVDEKLTNYYYPNFKPDFNADLLKNCNYICHFFVTRKMLCDEIGGFREDYDGSQDFDFILRITNKAEKVKHIPRILYHWRVHKNSVALAPNQKEYCYDAAIRAIVDNNTHHDNLVEVKKQTICPYYYCEYDVREIPRVLLVSYQSDYSKEIDDTDWDIQHCRANSVIEINRAIKDTQCDTILILKDVDTLPSSRDVKNMVSNIQRYNVAMTTPKILYRKKIKYFGVYWGDDNKIYGNFTNVPMNNTGYFARAYLQQYVNYPSLDCICFSRDVFTKYQGFPEHYSYEEAILDFAMYINQKQQRISALADVVVQSKKPFTCFKLSKDFIEKWREQKTSEKLVVFPPY